MQITTVGTYPVGIGTIIALVVAILAILGLLGVIGMSATIFWAFILALAIARLT